MAVYPSFFYRILLRRYRLPWLATPKKEEYTAIDYIAASVENNNDYVVTAHNPG